MMNDNPSFLVFPNLILIEKLDIGSQIQRINAIEELENESFAQKPFKATSAFERTTPFKLDGPLPALELKPVNLSNLDKEILCHPSVSIFANIPHNLNSEKIPDVDDEI